uniref:Uncharacterized protein n=1 Tax=uncultured marine thaumarchaeote KM3_130_G11 TaxID=1456000 RepID=A0A075G9I0_9ARCH|nr:hypothetical protein [uncultured marine thaumarchaeote KM3_130_G11]
MITFPFGAITLRVISSPRSVVPLTSIVVEPSTPPAVSDNPLPGEAAVTIDDVVLPVELAAIVLTDAEASEELISTDTEYFEALV